MITIGVDLGGTMIKLGLLDSGELVATTKLISQAQGSLADRLPAIEKGVEGLMSSYGISSTLLKGIGLTLPQVVDPVEKKMISRYVKFADAAEVDLTQWAADTWGIPLALENDARAALWGEVRFGAGQGYSDVAIVTLGTGVGSAAMLKGELVNGANFVGGNLFGHTVINFDGDPCNCGARGCVETEASGWAVHNKWKDHEDREGSAIVEGEITYRRVFKYADEGDSFSIKIRDHALEVWAVVGYNIVHSIDPKLLIIGGGIGNSADVIVPFIQKHLDEKTWLPVGATQVVAAKDVDFAGALGMADLAIKAANNAAG